MKTIYTKAYIALKKMGVPVYTRHDMDGRFQISAEEPESYKWADYYETYHPDWNFGVNPKIDEILNKHGLFAEWINPGELGVYEN